MSTLVVIPARAGSKGLPGKNVRPLSGKALIVYTFDFARDIVGPGDEICVSTNDQQVVTLAKENGVEPKFLRPEHLSDDRASMFDVLLHAIQYYESRDRGFDKLLLLQPTSPFREAEDFEKLREIFGESGCDMAVSVVRAKENPYFSLFELQGDGFLKKSKPGHYVRRQDCPEVFAYNGSMYLINIKALRKAKSLSFDRVAMMEMPKERSIDIDDIDDFNYAQYVLNARRNEDD